MCDMTKTHKELLNVVMNMNQFEKYESIQVTLCRNSSVILKLWATCPTEYKDIGNISSDSFNNNVLKIMISWTEILLVN